MSAPASAPTAASAPAPANNNTRPASFDAAVMAYRPGLYSLSRRLVKGREAQDDLVTDTIIAALHRWTSFRGPTAGKKSGLWSWLSLTMRGIARDNRIKAARAARADAELAHTHISVAATQHDHAELVEAVGRIPDDRCGEILVRRAMGDTLLEIGADYCISRERVRQLECRARAQVVGDTTAEAA